jgi:hypothetical protein
MGDILGRANNHRHRLCFGWRGARIFFYCGHSYSSHAGHIVHCLLDHSELGLRLWLGDASDHHGRNCSSGGIFRRGHDIGLLLSHTENSAPPLSRSRLRLRGGVAGATVMLTLLAAPQRVRKALAECREYGSGANSGSRAY